MKHSTKTIIVASLMVIGIFLFGLGSIWLHYNLYGPVISLTGLALLVFSPAIGFVLLPVKE